MLTSILIVRQMPLVDAIDTLSQVLERKGYTFIKQEDDTLFFKRNGWLWSTYIFAVIDLQELNSFSSEIQESYSWVVKNIKPRNSLAQIGFNVVICSSEAIHRDKLLPLINMHAIKDPKTTKSNTARWLFFLVYLPTMKEDIIFQTICSIGYGNSTFASARTWVLFGSVRSSFNAIKQRFA